MGQASKARCPHPSWPRQWHGTPCAGRVPEWRSWLWVVSSEGGLECHESRCFVGDQNQFSDPRQAARSGASPCSKQMIAEHAGLLLRDIRFLVIMFDPGRACTIWTRPRCARFIYQQPMFEHVRRSALQPRATTDKWTRSHSSSAIVVQCRLPSSIRQVPRSVLFVMPNICLNEPIVYSWRERQLEPRFMGGTWHDGFWKSNRSVEGEGHLLEARGVCRAW
ncbi:hypothetical protein IQ07DRAFT_164354 [Pyrenochaeta sp. DS3sAY3a]|nr:hypothetical protein IQ07DRAFT_164354 [Pyrenochaeta sp. DS3sAY3a]